MLMGLILGLGLVGLGLISFIADIKTNLQLSHSGKTWPLEWVAKEHTKS